jgi:GT2 family glycosyltransferase
VDCPDASVITGLHTLKKPEDLSVPDHPRVAIVALNWNGYKDTLACLRSLEELEYQPAHTIVVDNGSQDGSVEKIREAFPGVEIIAHPVNTGYAEGNNIGMRAVMDRSDYILLLNNDTLVAPDLLTVLVDAAESDPRIAVVGPVICFAEQPDTIWCAGLKMGRGSMYGFAVNRTTSTLMHTGDTVDKLPEKLYEVDAVVGCAMLLRVRVLKEIGLLDEKLFMIHEDFDWSLRAWEHGYRCLVIPRVGVWHRVSVSIKRQDQKRRGNPTALYYWYRNWLLVVKKHFGFRNMLVVVGLYAFRLFPALVLRDMLRRIWAPSIWFSMALALWDALIGSTRRRYVR